jgi:TPP-dependent pyruvate/acetoin dehydrogenase alpha subunit
MPCCVRGGRHGRLATCDMLQSASSTRGRATVRTSWRVITYRFRGHSMGDPERYRECTRSKWQEDDPITRWANT